MVIKKGGRGPGHSVRSPSAFTGTGGGTNLLMEDGTDLLREDGVTTFTLDTVPTAGTHNGTSSPELTGYTLKNVMTDYGAVGDGVTNDTTALQNAANAQASGWALRIPTPPAFYKTTALIQWANKTNIIVYGDGPDLSIIKPSTDANTAIQFVNCNGLQLFDFSTRAVNQTVRNPVTNARGISLDGCRNVWLKNVLIDGVAGAGLLAYQCRDVNVTSSKIQNNLADGFHFTGAGTNRVSVESCTGATNGDDSFASIGYYPDTNRNISFWNNVSTTSAASGVSFEGTENGRAQGNAITASAVGGIRVNSGTSYGTMQCTNISLTFNTLTGVRTSLGVDHGAIMVYANNYFVSGLTIGNNTIVDPLATKGVFAYGTSAAQFVSGTASNNTMLNTTGNLVTPFSISTFATLPYAGQGNTFNGAGL